jgi:pyruvate formate lyase activating enzyme
MEPEMGQAAAARTPLEAKSEFELRVDLAKAVPETSIHAALASGDIGFLHSFTTGSAVDGPGVRLVAWTASCMFRCRFCHNPDTWVLQNGLPVPLSKAVEELRKYANGLIAMKGGLTISGGEPLMQHRFVVRLFAAAKELRVHTALETNGLYGSKLSDAELADIDLVILDMKAVTPEQHERVTGVRNNGPVLEFARRLAGLGRPMWLRHVLVPGLTDVESELKALAAFGASLGVVERTEILPFHQLGRYKWERLGLDYTLAAADPPSAAAVASAVAVFREAGLNAC